ncbi:proline rich transmembrane protein 1B-like [Crassostrea virginica]
MSSQQESQPPPEYSEVIKQPGLYGPGPQNPTLQYQPTGGVSYPCYIYHAQDGGQVHSPVAVVTQLGQGSRIVTSEPHQDWTLPAIISCLCCFWPTGIFAIWYASKANHAAERGDTSEADVQASRARSLVIMSSLIGFCLMILWISLSASNRRYHHY